MHCQLFAWLCILFAVAEGVVGKQPEIAVDGDSVGRQRGNATVEAVGSQLDMLPHGLDDFAWRAPHDQAPILGNTLGLSTTPF